MQVVVLTALEIYQVLHFLRAQSSMETIVVSTGSLVFIIVLTILYQLEIITIIIIIVVIIINH